MIRNNRTCLFALMITGTICASAQAATFSVFTNPQPLYPTPTPPATDGTIGFAYAGNKFVGTVLQNGTGSLYSTDLSGGNVQLFAPTVNLTSSNQEHYVSASSGLGGFPNGDVYAANGNSITHITNNGANSNTLVSGLIGDVRGITFDLQGSFANCMLVTTNSGCVYKVTSGGGPNAPGTASLLANVGEDVEGLDVAPLGGGFSSFDGQLMVASEGTGFIRAISPGGQVTPLSNGSLGNISISHAEELTFIPLNVGTGGPLEGLYGSNYTPNVLFAGANQFTSMADDIIVTSEIGSQVSDIHWNGSQFVVSQIGSFPNQPEDGVYVSPKMIELGSQVTPEPSSLALMVTASVLGLGITVRPRFLAHRKQT